ncbi:MAG: AMP-binding protein [Clostridia bacterium]|nr:AMP-binding protein [Clostridia bacterium]
MLIHENLAKHALNTPNKLCLIHGNHGITYQELNLRVQEISKKLSSLLSKGEKVVLKFSSPIDQICHLLASSTAGTAAVLMDAADTSVFKHIKKESESFLLIDEHFEFSFSKSNSLPHIEPSDLFLGALSSGSTGNPKIIWRDHQSWTFAFPYQRDIFGITESDRVFLTGSLVYTANLNTCLHALFEGGTVVFASYLTSKSWIKEILYSQITAIFMVPAHYRLLLRASQNPITSVRTLVGAGAKLDFHTFKELMYVFPQGNIYEYFGASETSYVTYSAKEDLLRKPDSVGKAFPKVTFHTDENSIHVMSPYLAPHYRPAASINDIGKIDSEGYLFLLGRNDHVINKGGIKIHPAEVEKVLMNCPFLREAVVKGIRDPLRGETLACWIVRKDSAVSISDIKSFCNKNLPRTMRPQNYFPVEEIPKMPSGKVDYTRLCPHF